MKKMTEREGLANYLAIHSLDNPMNIGLLTGRMGHVLALSVYSKRCSIEAFDRIADFLFEQVAKVLSRTGSVNFGSGSAGICWAIEYLVQHGYMEGPAHDSCADLDKHICEVNIVDMDDYSLESGLLGLWEYLIARIQGNMMAGLPLPFGNEYLSRWLGVLETHPAGFPENAAARLSAVMEGVLIEEELGVERFINKGELLNPKDLSLRDGVAGRLILMCL